MIKKYTKADLESNILVQLENLNAMNELVNTMKYQNELINKASRRFEKEILEYKQLKYYKDSMEKGKK